MEVRKEIKEINSDAHTVVDIIIKTLQDIWQSHILISNKNHELKSFLVNFADFMSEEEKNIFKSKFKDNITGNENTYQIVINILNDSVKIEHVSQSQMIRNQLIILMIACMRKKNNETIQSAKDKCISILLMMNDLLTPKKDNEWKLKRKFKEAIESNHYFFFLSKTQEKSFSLKDFFFINQSKENPSEDFPEIPTQILIRMGNSYEHSFASLKDLICGLLNDRVSYLFTKKYMPTVTYYESFDQYQKLISDLKPYIELITGKDWLDRHTLLISIGNSPIKEIFNDTYDKTINYNPLNLLCDQFERYHKKLQNNLNLLIIDLAQNQIICLKALYLLSRYKKPTFPLEISEYSSQLQKSYDEIFILLLEKFNFEKKDIFSLWLNTFFNYHTNNISYYILDKYGDDKDFKLLLTEKIFKKPEVIISLFDILLNTLDKIKKLNNNCFNFNIKYIIENAFIGDLTNLIDEISSLHFLCKKNRIAIPFISKVLNRGININAIDEIGKTGLHHLCDKEDIDLELLEFLIANGANPLIKDNLGYNCLDHLTFKLSANNQFIMNALNFLIQKNYTEMSEDRALAVLLDMSIKKVITKYPYPIIVCTLYNCDYNNLLKKYKTKNITASEDYEKIFQLLKNITEKNSKFSFKDFMDEMSQYNNTLARKWFDEKTIEKIKTLLLCLKRNEISKIPKPILSLVLTQCKTNSFFSYTPPKKVSDTLQEKISFIK